MSPISRHRPWSSVTEICKYCAQSTVHPPLLFLYLLFYTNKSANLPKPTPSSYKFDVTFYHEAVPIHCEALGTTINHQLTSIPQTFCPTGPSPGDGSGSGYGNDTNNNQQNNNTTGPGVSFKWTEQPDGSGALLIVRRINDKVTDTAVYKVTPDCMPMMGDDIFRHQVYEGPENFSVPAYRSSESG